jgi:hypothetical protein
MRRYTRPHAFYASVNLHTSNGTEALVWCWVAERFPPSEPLACRITTHQERGDSTRQLSQLKLPSSTNANLVYLKAILKTEKLMIRLDGCGALCCLGGLYGDTPGIFPPYAGKASDGSSPRTDV